MSNSDNLEEKIYLLAEEEKCDSETSAATHANQPESIRSTRLRWVMLFFGCLFLMGSYYCLDNPAALSTYLEDSSNEFSLTPKQVNMLYSVYSLPNVLLPLIGGILLDKVGIK